MINQLIRLLTLHPLRTLNVVLFSIFAFVFLVVSLTRIAEYPPDGKNYTNVAAHIAAGQGIVQSTAGYNQIKLISRTTVFPSALTMQPPLFPFAIAGVIRPRHTGTSGSTDCAISGVSADFRAHMGDHDSAVFSFRRISDPRHIDAHAATVHFGKGGNGG